MGGTHLRLVVCYIFSYQNDTDINLQQTQIASFKQECADLKIMFVCSVNTISALKNISDKICRCYWQLYFMACAYFCTMSCIWRKLIILIWRIGIHVVPYESILYSLDILNFFKTRSIVLAVKHENGMTDKQIWPSQYVLILRTAWKGHNPNNALYAFPVEGTISSIPQLKTRILVKFLVGKYWDIALKSAANTSLQKYHLVHPVFILLIWKHKEQSVSAIYGQVQRCQIAKRNFKMLLHETFKFIKICLQIWA
jgi:hypothetical protein